MKHVVSTRSYGHGIGAGDVNGDSRIDILTPQGWLEAPADPRAAGNWTFHATDWQQRAIPPPAQVESPSLTTPPAMVTPPAAAADPTAATPGAAAPGGRGAEWGFLHVLDVNGDGRNDVLTTGAHSYGICWFEQRADGQWQQHVIDHSWSHARVGACRRQRRPSPGPRVREAFPGAQRACPGDNDPLGIY